MQKLPKIFRVGLLKIITPIALITLVLSLAPQTVYAQVGAIGIAHYIPITGNKIEDGDIVVSTPKGYAISSAEYDPDVFGVVILKPAVELKVDSKEKTYPVVNSGTAIIKVTGVNGAIKKGDYITTSNTKGTGMRAAKSGYVLGQAIENVSFSSPKQIKTLTVIIQIHSLQAAGSSAIVGSLYDVFHLSKIASYEQPSKVLQYVVAAIITIASFAFGFLIFARAVNTGLEALGRNPLAGRMIQVSIVFNLILIVVIIVAGVSLAYLVIRL